MSEVEDVAYDPLRWRMPDVAFGNRCDNRLAVDVQNDVVKLVSRRPLLDRGEYC